MNLKVIIDKTTETIYPDCRSDKGRIDAEQLWLFTHLVPGQWTLTHHEEQFFFTAQAHGWSVEAHRVGEDTPGYPSQRLGDIKDVDFLTQSESGLFRPRTIYLLIEEMLADKVDPKLVEKETREFLKAVLDSTALHYNTLTSLDRSVQVAVATGADYADVEKMFREGLSTMIANKEMILKQARSARDMRDAWSGLYEEEQQDV